MFLPFPFCILPYTYYWEKSLILSLLRLNFVASEFVYSIENGYRSVYSFLHLHSGETLSHHFENDTAFWIFASFWQYCHHLNMFTKDVFMDKRIEAMFGGRNRWNVSGLQLVMKLMVIKNGKFRFYKLNYIVYSTFWRIPIQQILLEQIRKSRYPWTPVRAEGVEVGGKCRAYRRAMAPMEGQWHFKFNKLNFCFP